jgi:hypothetical protein
MDPANAEQRCPHFVPAEMIDLALASPEPAGDLSGSCPQCGESLKIPFRVTRPCP